MCKAQSRNIQEVLYGLFERRKTLLKDVEKEKVFSYCLDKKPRRMGGVLNGGVDGIRTRGLCLDRAAC